MSDEPGRCQCPVLTVDDALRHVREHLSSMRPEIRALVEGNRAGLSEDVDRWCRVAGVDRSSPAFARTWCLAVQSVLHAGRGRMHPILLEAMSITLLDIGLAPLLLDQELREAVPAKADCGFSDQHAGPCDLSPGHKPPHRDPDQAIDDHVEGPDAAQ